MYIAEAIVIEVAKNGVAAAVVWPQTVASYMGTVVSASQMLTQPPQQPGFIQQQQIQQTERIQEYMPAYPRGLGFGFSHQKDATFFPTSSQAPVTWQSSTSSFGVDAPPSVAWGWGEGGQ